MKAPAAAILASCLLLPTALCGQGCAPPPPAAAAKTVAYDVGGMHCSGCAEAITIEVSAVKGVKAVACTIETRRAVITLEDPAAEPLAEKAITKMHYTLTKVAPDAPLSAEAQAANAAKAAAQPAAAEPSSK
jgi:copper chaperone CopZ